VTERWTIPEHMLAALPQFGAYCYEQILKQVAKEATGAEDVDVVRYTCLAIAQALLHAIEVAPAARREHARETFAEWVRTGALLS
jgi:hypothetical protein